MNLPKKFPSLADSLVSLFGSSVSIAHTERISGGDINKSYGLTLNSGEHIFMKANAKENFTFFESESMGLSAIAQTNAIKTPKIFCMGTDDGEEVGYSFLLMEFIETGEKKSDFWEKFARSVAKMHDFDTTSFVEKGAKFGFLKDNFIGARPQKNSPSKNWISFFRDFRLIPQFKAADSYFSDSDRKMISKFLDNLEKILVEPEKPSLLHGDFWSGNYLCDSNGEPVLIDPACYIGHFEADIAMTQLFGGFPQKFYDSYREVQKFQPNYEDRRDIYNLYHILNHLNMFGRQYLPPVQNIIREYVG